MTAQDAYNKVIFENPGFYGKEVIETRSVFVVPIRPIGVSFEERYFTGTTFPAVEKKSGRVIEYDMMSDMIGYQKGKVHKVQTVFDEVVKEG